MTPRERVRRALDFQRPDRVPIDLGGMRASGIAATVYERLRARLGLRPRPIRLLDSMQLLAEVEPEVLDALHIDVIPLDVTTAAWQMADASAGVEETLPSGTNVRFPPGTNVTREADGAWLLRDGAGRPFARMPAGGYYFDFIRPTMAGTIDPARWAPPMTVSDEDLAAVARLAEHLDANTDRAVLAWGASLSLCGLSALLADNITQGSLDAWLVMLMTEKQTAHEMMGKYVDSCIARLALYHQAVGGRCVAWGMSSDDAGTQRSELFSPDLFAEMIKPHYKRLCEWIHAHTPWKTFLHSCGCVHGFIQHWIDAGVDILNPVQISAERMGPRRLMEDFGGRIVFWGGGCDTQHYLPLAGPEEVRRHVRDNLEAFRAREGGFVFTQVHNIQPNVPAENVQAMLAAAHEYGGGG